MSKITCAIKDANGLVTPEGRAAIFAVKGKMSLRKAQAHFGVSSRTIGRIFNAGECAPKEAADRGAEVQSLKDIIAQQQQMIEKLLAQPAQVPPPSVAEFVPRYRRELNPAWHEKATYTSEHNYSSPYRDRPGTKVVIFRGIEVPIPSFFSLEKTYETDAFIKKHPVSPGCEKYPYPKKLQTESRYKNQAQEVFRDPKIGIYCDCDVCNKWRFDIAYEDEMQFRYLHASQSYALFHRHK